MKVILAAWLLIAGCSGASKLERFEQDEKFGYRNRSGQTIIEPRFQEAGEFLDGGVALVLDSRWHYIDTRGETVFDSYFFDNGPDYVVEGYSRMVRNGKIGYINSNGNIVVEPRFDFAAPFSDGMAAFCEGCKEEPSGEHRRVVGGRWGFLDRTGAIVIPARFDWAQGFEGGKAEVGLDGKTIVIDRKGNALPNDH